MNKLSILLIFSLLFSISGKAQTVAQNWTKTDCDGNTHTLYNYLDSGKVVIMQFDMMNCSFCTDAAKFTDPLAQRYEKEHPGKLKMFTLGYSNSTVCADMQAWKKQY